MDAVERLSIPKGPLLAHLKAGRSVTLPNGSVVEPSHVVDAPRPGRTHLHLGDTCDSRNAMLIAKGADWVVHESTFDDANQVGIALFPSIIEFSNL
jgi:ribonuclease Z